MDGWEKAISEGKKPDFGDVLKNPEVQRWLKAGKKKAPKASADPPDKPQLDLDKAFEEMEAGFKEDGSG